MKIREADDRDWEAWDQAVHTLPEGTFCHLSGWRKVVQQNFGFESVCLIAEDSGGITGLLPLYHTRRWPFPSALISSPVCVYGGTLATEAAVHEALATHALELAKKRNVKYVELRDQTFERPNWTSTDLYFTFRKDLPESPDDTLTSIPTKQRAEVRKGIKAGLTFDTSNDIDTFYPIYAESIKSLGSPGFKRKYYESLLEVFGEQAEVATAFHEGQPASSVINFYFKNEVLLYYGGGIAASRELRSTQYLYWQVMNQALSRGASTFDFGRSMRDTGTYNFKTYWKFEPQPLTYHYHAVNGSVPDLSPENPRLAMASKVWAKLPGVVTDVVGPMVAKAIV